MFWSLGVFNSYYCRDKFSILVLDVKGFQGKLFQVSRESFLIFFTGLLPILILQVMKDDQLFLPVTVVREWQDHHQVGSDFKAWMEKFLARNGKVIDPEEEAKKKRQQQGDQGNPSPENGKRAGGSENTSPQQKRARVEGPALDEKYLVNNSDVAEALVSEIKLQSKEWPTLQLRSEGACLLMNKTEKSWQQTDPVISFFGAGAYKILKDGQDLPDKSVALEFKDYTDIIVLNGAVQTLGDAMAEMRAKKPDCKICYFELDTSPGLNEFTLKNTHRVIFSQKNDDNKELGRQNAGFSLPFRTSGLLRLVWHCRWTTKGLSPIKPAIHLIGQINLPAGHAIKLHVAWSGQCLHESGFMAFLIFLTNYFLLTQLWV